MNVRTLTNPITSLDGVTGSKATRPVKTEISSEDRDANGRREQPEENKNPLSDEEMRKAREYIENLEGLKANHLKLTIEEGGEYRVFLIHDLEGKLVRRIVEWEMRSIIDGADKKTGQIFDKSA